jgi:hypothetical protein
MASYNRRALIQGIQHADHVANQMQHRVLVDRLRGVSLAITTHVGCHDMKPGFGQGMDLMPPGIP